MGYMSPAGSGSLRGLKPGNYLWASQVLHWLTSLVANLATVVPHSHLDYVSCPVFQYMLSLSFIQITFIARQ